MHSADRIFGLIEEDADRTVRRVDFRELASRRILLTGASGLLGIHFLACLRQALGAAAPPFDVSVVIFSEPDPLLRHFAGHPRIRVHRGDLGDPLFCRSLPKCDFVIHSAGYAQPGLFTADPVRTLKLNTIATFELIERLNPGGSFLFASSAEVYTGLAQGPFRESQIGTTLTTHPRACYIEGKRTGETICNAFREAGVSARSARIALTYGPGTKRGDRRVLNMFVEKALHGRIDLMDQGEALRTFLYVSDAVEIMWQILLHGRAPIYNVGGTDEISILDLARRIGAILDMPVSVPHASGGLPGAPATVRLDMSLAEQEFGRRELMPLDVGLARTIEWQRCLYKL